MRYPTPPSPPTDITDVIESDHRAAERTLGGLEAGVPADPAERRTAARGLVTALARDSAAKEAHLYPFMRRFLPDGEDVARRQVAGNGRVEHALKELDQELDDERDARFEDPLERLTALVRIRFAEEARAMPKLAGATTVRQRRDCGRRMLAAKRGGPTRPHPAGPDEPPLNRIAHRGLALADRVRDAVGGRRG